ncbi:MAG TPA: glycosyltransferase [Methanocella sp.]|jgi:glycosyltransferase involved in cell wall biosynthesis
MEQAQQVILHDPVAENGKPGTGKATITIVIPTINEPAIDKVIRDACQSLKDYDFEIVVVDKSTDDTPLKAGKAGARVIVQKDTGYGSAYLLGFRSASPESDIIVMIDGDDTYDPFDIPLLIDPILNGNADMVLGNRFSHMEQGAMTARNRFGNRVITVAINVLFRLRLKDSQTGLRALRASALDRLEFISDGMPFASEMIIDAHKKSLNIAEVPVSYRRRIGEAKMKAYRDGSLIAGLVIRKAQERNPLAIFLPLGLLMMLGGVVLWVIVLQEWLTTGTINRLASAAGGTMLFLAGLQVIILGVLAGILVSIYARR